MSSFSSFKITDVGLNLEYKAQTGKILKFTKFKVGDGKLSTTDIEQLTDLINPILEQEVDRLDIQTTDNVKNVQIGFNIDNKNITTGFYLREIGLYAEDPDTKEEVLMFYSNCGDTADYISDNSSGTLAEKIIDIELYISNVENITATIDTSTVYATKEYVDSKNTTTITYIDGQITDTKEYVDQKITGALEGDY
jgi:phage-related tail fiber protein